MQPDSPEQSERRRIPWFGDSKISANAYAVRVEFDAFKGIPAGSDVIFNPSREWKNGAIAVISRDGNAVLRRMTEDGAIKKLIAHDSAPWQTEPFDPERDDILGVKIGVILIDD